MKKAKLLMLTLVGAAACAPAEGSKGADPEGGRTASKKVAPEARATRVEVATVGASDATLDLVLPGEVEGSKIALLASPMGGYVEGVYVDVGDAVKTGQALAAVDRSTYDVRLTQAKIQLDQATTDFEAVERAGKSIAKTRRDQARFAKDGAQAAFDLAELQAKRATVRAPFSGVVADRRVEKGEVLPPGGAVVRLVRLDPIRINLSVSDRDVVNLDKGMAVRVSADASTGVRNGKIERISPAASLNTRTFEVLVEVDNDDKSLRPGMIATVRAKVPVAGEGLSIPQYVLVTRLEGNGVFVEQEGVARWRDVELGGIVRGQVLVKSGINVGDRVVVTGHRELADGDKLLVAREGKCCRDGQVIFGDK